MENASPERVVAQLHMFGMSRDRLRAAMGGVLGVGVTDIDALEYLERFGSLTPRDLGARLLLTSGAVTLLVDRLERLGLVVRRPHPDDRRSMLIELAPGAALPELAEMDSYHRDLRAAAKTLTPGARGELVHFLNRVAGQADAASAAMRTRTQPRRRPSKDATA